MTRIRLAAGVVSAVVALAGCVSYTTYPPVGGRNIAADTANAPSARDAMVRALEWVIRRYPASGGGEWEAARYAVNLPMGMRRSLYLQVVERLGEEATALTPETGSLPTYHVARVWVRGRSAKVDIVRPLSVMGPKPSGAPVCQGITITLEGGLRPWHVVAQRIWEVGTLGVPEPNYLPAVERPERENKPAEPEAAAEPAPPPSAEPGPSPVEEPGSPR